VQRKVYDCCGGRGKHLPGCDGGTPKKRPRKEHKDRAQAIKNTQKYEKCPPHAPFEWGDPDKDGKYKHQCSKCTRQLGVW
jgi:hypothetical protein